jgi:serine/threonine protein kinase
MIGHRVPHGVRSGQRRWIADPPPVTEAVALRATLPIGVEAGTVVAGRFEIERRAHRGSGSSVFRARDRRTGGIVALKILHRSEEDEPRARLFREASILEQLRHPGIVRYIAHGETESEDAYLAMAWVDGEPLGDRLLHTELTKPEALAVVTKMAENLSAAHIEGIVHRDIKPGNVILQDDDARRPMLIDFGIARIGLDPSVLTTAGVVIGTLGYMAPEQASGARRIDARADVFALGAVLYRCLTGRPAYEGREVFDIVAKLISGPTPRIRALWSDAPPALDDLIARMMSREPRDRPRDAGAVASQLAPFASLR